MRALTAMIHLERDPRLGAIIEATGASTYHGFLPSLVRECITSLTGTLNIVCLFVCLFGGLVFLLNEVFPYVDANAQTYPQTFATALFSFLYHLATYEASESNGCVYQHSQYTTYIMSLYNMHRWGCSCVQWYNGVTITSGGLAIT